MTDPVLLVDDYLANGGQFNPECMEHDKVRALILALRDELVTSRDNAAQYRVFYDNAMRRANENATLYQDALRRIQELTK